MPQATITPQRPAVFGKRPSAGFVASTHPEGYGFCQVKWVPPFDGSLTGTTVKVELQVFDGLGNRVVVEQTIDLPVDSSISNAKPAININNLSKTSYVQGESVQLSGSASDVNAEGSQTGIANLALSYAIAGTGNWQEINQHVSLDENGQWSYNWPLPEGLSGNYTIRLIATNTLGNTAESTVNISVGPRLLIEGAVVNNSGIAVANAKSGDWSRQQQV